MLSRIHGTDLTPAEVKEQGDFIGRKLSSCVLRHLVTGNNVVELRWRVGDLPFGIYSADLAKLAQFLSVLIHFSSAARDEIVGMRQW